MSSLVDTPIVPLLQTVFTSILEVFLLCLAGYILAARGILDKKTQKQLNRLNVSLFTPSLLFSKVAFFLSPAKMRELWIIPLFFAVVTVVSMTVAIVLGWMFRLKKSERNFAMAAAMFMNSNSLPIALMQSLVVTVHGLKWGDDDNKNAMLGRALTYLVLYSTLGMVLRWSYGVRLLSAADSEATPPQPVLGHAEQEPLLITLGDEEDHHRSSTSLSASTFAGEPEDISPQNSPARPKLAGHSTFYRSFPNSPNQSRAHLPPIDSTAVSRENSVLDVAGRYTDAEPLVEVADADTAADADTSTLPLHHRDFGLTNGEPSHRSTAGKWTRTGRWITRFWFGMNDFMTVPLWAALTSVVVALIAPLQHALENHMQPVKGALTQAGNCSIPLTLVVLGAYFYPEKKENHSSSRGRTMSMKGMSQRLRSMLSLRSLNKPVRPQLTRSATEIRTEGETKTVVIAIVSRMILTPMLIIPAMAAGTYFDLHPVFLDPVFVVSIVLLISSPPALTLAQITQAASGDAFERLISRTIFWSYCIITPPATIIYVVIGLLLAKL